MKGGINFLPPASTSQSTISSPISSDPALSVSQTALPLAPCTVTTASSSTTSFPPLQSPTFPIPSPCPPAHTSAPNIPSTIPSTSHSAMNHPSLVTPVQPFLSTSSITHNSQQVASPISHGKPTLQYNIAFYFDSHSSDPGYNSLPS